MIRQLLLLVLATVAGAITSKWWITSSNRPAEEFDGQSGAYITQARHVPQLDFEGVPLRKALDSIADSFHVSLTVNWRADYEKAQAKLLNVHLRNASLDDALHSVLQSEDQGDLSYIIHDGVVVIGQNHNFPDAWRETRVYDVRDLIDDYLRYEPTPEDDYHMAIAGFLDKLTRRLQFDFGWWLQAGELSGRLIITTDPSTHREIEEFLRATRRAVKNPAALDHLLALPQY